jgi:hypothetical protein
MKAEITMPEEFADEIASKVTSRLLSHQKPKEDDSLLNVDEVARYLRSQRIGCMKEPISKKYLTLS